jgi:PAS domain S-box-containing protein
MARRGGSRRAPEKTVKAVKAAPRRGAPASPPKAVISRAGVVEPKPGDLFVAFESSPHASFLAADGLLVLANGAFHRALGLPPGAAPARRLDALLPPEEGALPTPRPGATRSYRTRVGCASARVDLTAAPELRPDGTSLVSGVLTVVQDAADTAAERALLELSRALAAARAEDEVTAALSRAVELLFPGRAFSIRLVDPRTLALTTFYGRGRLRAGASRRLAVREDAARRAGLDPEALRTAGAVLGGADEPLFQGCQRALFEPLAVSGELFGLLGLEYTVGEPGDRDSDAPLLRQVASHAALGVRNLRSIEEATRLKTELEHLIEHANALIFAVDRDRRVTVWNASIAHATGWTRAGALGTDVLVALAPEDRARVKAAIERALAGESADAIELRLLRRTGGEARASVSLAPQLGASGEVEGAVAIGQDLTLVRSLQAAAEHAERLAAIGRLVAGVVHELNNPLTAVTMYSDVLVERLAARGHDPADVEKLRAIKDAGQRIQRLARDLVTYARPTGARTEPVDLGSVVDEALRMAKPALKESSAVVARVGAAGPLVEANRPSLVQVVLALVTNAAQAVAQGGKIEVALANDGTEAVLTVRDEGSGMPADVAARAFEPFFTTRAGVGIGLGLPIVSGIVERHGGTVALDTAPGRGTTVTVRLPVRAR